MPQRISFEYYGRNHQQNWHKELKTYENQLKQDKQENYSQKAHQNQIVQKLKHTNVQK